jgi:hypothetical protein
MNNLTAVKVSKQAIKKKVTNSTTDFMQKILTYSTERKFISDTELNGEQLPFKRILIQDSTLLRLPKHLHEAFSGNVNQHQKIYPQMRIQSVYDCTNNTFEYFSISSYTKNDMAASDQILAVAQSQDLVIRDLGYFKCDVFNSFVLNKVNFLSRLYAGVSIYDAQKKGIDLLKVLNKTKCFDRNVLIGKGCIPVRLIAIPVDPALAKDRRIRLKNKDSRYTPSKKMLALCNWSIFITNVKKDVLSAKQIAKLYKVRWRIETIFKTWKSYCGFKNFPVNSSELQLISIMYARFLFITLTHQIVSENIDLSSEVSIQKVVWYVASYLWNLILEDRNLASFFETLRYYCQYEKRQRKPLYLNAFPEKYIM